MQETLVLVLLIAITGLLWVIANRQRTSEDRLSRLDRLEDIRSLLTRLVESGGNLELRRLEHVLIDIRDGHKRVEERLLSLAENARSQATQSDQPAPLQTTQHAPSGTTLSERIHNRLLAMGYERIQIITSLEELGEMAEGGGDGDVTVEARRAGATCKGIVSLKSSGIANVDLSSAHTMFP